MQDVQAGYGVNASGSKVPLHVLPNATDDSIAPGPTRSVFFPIRKRDWEAMSAAAQSRLYGSFCPVIQAGDGEDAGEPMRWKLHNLIALNNGRLSVNAHGAWLARELLPSH